MFNTLVVYGVMLVFTVWIYSRQRKRKKVESSSTNGLKEEEGCAFSADTSSYDALKKDAFAIEDFDFNRPISSFEAECDFPGEERESVSIYNLLVENGVRLPTEEEFEVVVPLLLINSSAKRYMDFHLDYVGVTNVMKFLAVASVLYEKMEKRKRVVVSEKQIVGVVFNKSLLKTTNSGIVPLLDLLSTHFKNKCEIKEQDGFFVFHLLKSAKSEDVALLLQATKELSVVAIS